MATQTLNTASVATTLNVGDNITTGGIGIGSSITSGSIEIGGFTGKTGEIRIGDTGVDGNTLLYTRDGDITARTWGTGDIVLRSAGAITITADTLTMGVKGEVTQITSQTTGVTINSSIGKITTVSLTIANHSSSRFTVTNDKVTADSIILCNIAKYTGTSTVSCIADAIASGTFDVILQNNGGGVLTALAIIHFLVL